MNDTTTLCSMKILRLPAVQERIGLSRTAIYDRINKRCKRYDPTFPKPVSLGGRAVGWYDHEINAWLETRPSL